MSTVDDIEAKADAAVDHVIREYGETLRMFGKE